MIWPSIGTCSLLFGVHQFLWHPLTVGLAWRKLYKKWPDREEWLAIFFHDWGYWGCPNIDGPEGRLHPERGARLAQRVAKRLRLDHDRVYELAICHSREYIKRHLPYGEPSLLCWADKYSIIYEPQWFYLLRSTLSGELKEFQRNATKSGHLPGNHTRREWFRNYKRRVVNNPDIKIWLKGIDEKTLCPLSAGGCARR